MINRIKIYFVTILLFIASHVVAQSGTFNPYSMFGVGEMDMGEYGRTTGMAGVGIGLGVPNSLSILNPASLSGVDSTTFLWDFALSTKYSQFQDITGTESTFNATFKKIALGFQVLPKWGISMGVTPFSAIGYNLKKTQITENSSDTYDVSFEGSGGLSKMYLSNAFKILPFLSIGVNSSFVFGSISQNQYLGTSTYSSKSNVQKLIFDFGLLFNKTIGKTGYSLGLIYGYKSSLNMNGNVLFSSPGDTIEKYSFVKQQFLPAFYGIGISANIKEKLTFAFDYRFQNWSSIPSGYNGVYFKNVQSAKFGIDYVPSARVFSNYFQLIHYQVGAAISNSYYQIKNIDPINYSVTLGVDLPFRNASALNLAVELGKSGSATNGVIQEKFTAIHLNVLLNERWFLKRKYD